MLLLQRVLLWSENWRFSLSDFKGVFNIFYLNFSMQIDWYSSWYWYYTDWLLVLFRLVIGILQIGYWYYAVWLLLLCRLVIGILQIGYWHSADWLLVFCKLVIGILLIGYWSYEDWLLVSCRLVFVMTSLLMVIKHTS